MTMKQEEISRRINNCIYELYKINLDKELDYILNKNANKYNLLSRIIINVIIYCTVFIMTRDLKYRLNYWRYVYLSERYFYILSNFTRKKSG